MFLTRMNDWVSATGTRLTIATGLLGTTMLGGAGSALAQQGMKPEDMIQTRQAGYKFMAWNMGKLKGMLVDNPASFNKEQAMAAANAVQAVANSGMGALYVPGSDKGKGWAGVTVRDPELYAMTEAFMRTTRWRGPCELELIRDPRGAYYLIEINPRFPAWVYLSSAAGVHLSRAVVELALEQPLTPLADYPAGKMFVRISIDQPASIEDFQRVVTSGEIVRSSPPSEEV